MPSKPKRPCSRAGCRKLTTERYCEEHKREYRQQTDRERGTAHERGYTSGWRRYRERFLQEHPLCKHCEELGLITQATVVDHIKPHKGDMELFWDPANHQPLCKPHHDRKTAIEDGGFGK